MAYVVADRVQQTTATTGTGTVTFVATTAQMQSFSAGIGVGNQTGYCILDGNGTSWETGFGTVVSSTTFSRDIILESSNAGAAINLSANTHTIFGSNVAAGISRVVPPIRPAGSAFTWLNQNGATLTDTAGGPLVLSNTTNTAGGDALTAAGIAVPGASNFTYTVQAQCSGFSAGQFNQFVPIGVATGVNGAWNGIGPAVNTRQVLSTIYVGSWTSMTSATGTASQFGPTDIGVLPNPAWWRVSWVNSTTTLTFSWSPDGVTWFQVYTTSSPVLTPAYAFMGFDTHQNGVAQAPATISLNYWKQT